jgi:hypothetical protein
MEERKYSILDNDLLMRPTRLNLFSLVEIRHLP